LPELVGASQTAGDRLLDAGEVAELLAVPERWVREHARGGLLPHVRLGRYVRFDRADVLAWVDEQKAGGAAWRKHRPVHRGGTR
jgi:excisionase family DNA binding protein